MISPGIEICLSTVSFPRFGQDFRPCLIVIILLLQALKFLSPSSIKFKWLYIFDEILPLDLLSFEKQNSLQGAL